MARTRGGGIERGTGRQRPTASIRRQRAIRAGQAYVEHDEAGNDTVPAGQPNHFVPQPQAEPELHVHGYIGGPHDISILTSYADHVAHKLWAGEDRGELKCVSHGRKLTKLGSPHVQIEQAVANSGLSPLISCSVETADKELLSALVERWHKKTSSFHLPVGEMTITLDDVSSILHLPITGALFSFDATQGAILLVNLLGVSGEAVHHETRHYRGAHVRLSWLKEIYESKCGQMRWTEAARAYLLHLVGCTIFADKSHTSVSVTFLELFRDLCRCAGYALGTAALTHMYYNLVDASFCKTRQLAGHATLLHVYCE